MEVYNKRPSGSGEQDCRACRWHRAGGRLGVPLLPAHTCGTFETAGQAATRERARPSPRSPPQPP
jgi:hypothetical protein